VTAPDPGEITDARAERSRQALLAAFSTLVQQQPYSTLTIRQIVRKSGVARSTFYEHFRNKDHVMVVAMEWPFGVLAANALGKGNRVQMIRLLTHFWDMRALARFLRTASLQHKLLAGLARRIEVGLPQRMDAGERGVRALALAASQWAPVMSWLGGEHPVTPQTMADVLMGLGRR
jgi:AcrR family transcriptional regulator